MSSSRHSNVRSCLDWRAIGYRYVVTEIPHGSATRDGSDSKKVYQVHCIKIPPASQGTVTTTSVGLYSRKRRFSS